MREDNINMLYDTLHVFNDMAYRKNGRICKIKLSERELYASEVLLPDQVRDICEGLSYKSNCVSGSTEYFCVNEDSYSAAIRIKKAHPDDNVLVFNFANPVNPGGGVRRGARAQEEDLCRKSSLLISLESQVSKKYYDYNRSLNTYMASDAIIMNPTVEIIKNVHGELLDDSVVVSVITCAAPMITSGIEGMTQDEYENMFYNRIVATLKVAAHYGYKYMVLGAWGCGAFGNDAGLIARLYDKALREVNYDSSTDTSLFKQIYFAILDRSMNSYNYNSFLKYFDGNRFYKDDRFSKNLSDCVSIDCSSDDKVVFFWKDDEPYGFLSNWYRCRFVIDDFEYQHVEQYIMAQKAKLFHDSFNYTAILRATEPRECKRLGRAVCPFDPAKWSECRCEVAKTAIRAKFEQNEGLRRKLLATGSAILAEASPKDDVWGIGIDAKAASKMDMSNWPGEGILGKILMEVRDDIHNALLNIK